MPNFFDSSPRPGYGQESFEPLCQSRGVTIERIRSNGLVNGEWYDQEGDEWVMLITGEATLEFENEEKRRLVAGDYLFIPARQRHRVLSTSADASWLAVHIGA